MRILIVDDDAAGLKVMALFMKPYGNVETSTNSFDALKLIDHAIRKNEPYDLFLLDIMMPEMNGHELLVEIRKREDKSTIKNQSRIIMVSALSDADNIMEAFTGKCDSYVIKPVRMEKLYSELEKLGITSK